MDQEAELYSIRQVIELTGMTEFLLRIWENRYGALKPKRSKTGRRLYSANDVLRAKTLSDLTGRGHKISQIAKKPLPSLIELLESDAETSTLDAAPPEIAKLFSFVERFEWDKVRALIFKKSESKKFIHQQILPLIQEMNQRVALKKLSVSQEHILSAYIKEALGTHTRSKVKAKSEVKMIFATPEGDLHDLGLLIASKLASFSGVDILFLGANMPKRDLAETCLRFKATHLVLSSTVSKEEGARSDFLQYLNFLDRNLPTPTAIWVAGRNTQKLRFSLDRGFKILHAFSDFEKELTHV